MRFLAMALDAVLIIACALLVHVWIAPQKIGSTGATPLPLLQAGTTLMGILLLMLLSGRLYRSWRLQSLGQLLRTIFLGWLAVVLVLMGLLFLSKTQGDVSRLWFLAWVGSALVAMWSVRLTVYAGLRWLRRLGYNYKTVLLVCGGESCHGVQQALAEMPWTGLKIQAVVLPSELEGVLTLPGKPAPDEVWLCLALGDKAGVEAALHALRHSTANIRLIPDWYSLRLMNYGISEVAGMPMLDLSTSPMTGYVRVVKALEDRVGALIILTFALLPMVLIALAVKLTSRGPVLFKQLRHGWNGQTIWVYKFRSMAVHQETDFQVTQASKCDPRLTRLGAFLRRTSLDELPQFINVLQGRMSIVGPRPHAVQHNEYYKELVPGYMLRHKVKPGITGWAQINGYRGETDTLEKMKKRIDYDLFYIENLSLWFDLKIIFKTLFNGWVHKNAY